VEREEHPFFERVQKIDKDEILATGKYHTKKSVKTSTGILHYDRWKQLTENRGGIELLISRKE